MANDRVFIKCDGCGAWKMLLKYDGARLRTTDNGILEWLDQHGMCHPHAFSHDLEGLPGFSLHTEDADSHVLAFDRQNALPPEGGELKWINKEK